MKESNLLKLCQLEASKHGAVTLRNNIGAYKHAKGYFIHYGVGGSGGSDLIGWTRDGRFLAIETKIIGRNPTPEQVNFLAQVNKAGGIGILAYSVEDVTKALCIEMKGNENGRK